MKDQKTTHSRPGGAMFLRRHGNVQKKAHRPTISTIRSKKFRMFGRSVRVIRNPFPTPDGKPFRGTSGKTVLMYRNEPRYAIPKKARK